LEPDGQLNPELGGEVGRAVQMLAVLAEVEEGDVASHIGHRTQSSVALHNSIGALMTSRGSRSVWLGVTLGPAGQAGRQKEAAA
jgi:hypothetical protein